MKLEKEQRDAQNVINQLSQLPQKSVGDIKRVGTALICLILQFDVLKARDAEARLGHVGRELQMARQRVLNLNKSQYEG